jgi:hypothetical protein
VGVRISDLRGWNEAVERARQLWPDIPGWAFELAGEQEAEIRTYEQAEWFSVHPVIAAEHAVRAACARGWRFDRRHL